MRVKDVGTEFSEFLFTSFFSEYCNSINISALFNITYRFVYNVFIYSLNRNISIFINETQPFNLYVVSS